MSGSVNKVFILGNLGSDPEVRFTGNGTAVCELRLATNERWKGKDGQAHEKVEWHRVVVWGKDAENAGKYLAKGRAVHVEGRLQTRDYEAKDGSKRYVTEIVATAIQYLGGGNRDGAGRRGGDDDGPPPPDGDAGNDGRGGFGGARPDDDLPFATCALDAEPDPVAPVLRIKF